LELEPTKPIKPQRIPLIIQNPFQIPMTVRKRRPDWKEESMSFLVWRLLCTKIQKSKQAAEETASEGRMQVLLIRPTCLVFFPVFIFTRTTQQQQLRPTVNYDGSIFISLSRLQNVSSRKPKQLELDSSPTRAEADGALSSFNQLIGRNKVIHLTY